MTYAVLDTPNKGLEEVLKSLKLDDGARNSIFLAVDDIFRYPPITKITQATGEGYDWTPWEPGALRSESNALDYEKIDAMMKTGQIALPMALKKAPIISIVNADSGFNIKSGDEKLAKVVHHNLREVLPAAIAEILTFLEYGAYFAEVTWEPAYPQDYGLPREFTPYWVISDFHGCEIRTIKELLFTEHNSFKGFIQQTDRMPEGINVGLDRALVIHSGKFGDMWGKSLLENVYVWWFWYEMIWRAFLRYLQRAGLGVVCVRAPQTSSVTINGRQINAMDYALQLAASLHKTNYAAIPSDVHRETNHQMWQVDYLKTGGENEGRPFIEALNMLGQNIRRFLLTGSAEGEEEVDIMLDTEQILGHVGMHISRYVLRKALMWNGSKSRRMFLDFQGADTRVLPLLFKLMAVAGNTAGSALQNVNWRDLFMRGGVPVLEEEEVEQLREGEEEKLKERYKQDDNRFGRTRRQYEEARQIPGGEGRWSSWRDKEGQAEKLELYGSIADIMNDDVIALTPEQVEGLSKVGLLVDDKPITLFNPYHDNLGKFTSQAHAVEPYPKDRINFKGDLPDKETFLAQDAASLAYERLGEEPREVNVYSKQSEYVAAVCGKDKNCAKSTKNSYAVATSGVIHLSPKAVALATEDRKLFEHVMTHEAFHTRKRSDGSHAVKAPDVTTPQGRARMRSLYHIEEGTTDLLSIKSGGEKEGYWNTPAGRTVISRSPHLYAMGAMAVLAGISSGWDRQKAWSIIDGLHYHINDYEYLEQLFVEVFGKPKDGWTDFSVFIVLQELQKAAAEDNFRSLGWLFG
jgi:hypothetical protein